MKKDNHGQPVNLAQLKRALVIGAEFEISSRFSDNNMERRRVNDADTTSIYSIVPFDANAKATMANNGRGSWLQFGKASFWRFKNGLCSRYPFDDPEKQTEDSLIFSIRIVEKEPGRDEAFESWYSELKKTQTEESEKEANRKATESDVKNQEQITTVINPVLDVLRNGGEINVFHKVKIYSADGLVKEQNVVLYIAEKYNVNIPLKLKGWINETLGRISIKNGKCYGYYRLLNKGGHSKTIFDYINKIISATAEPANSKNEDPEDAAPGSTRQRIRRMQK